MSASPIHVWKTASQHIDYINRLNVVLPSERHVCMPVCTHELGVINTHGVFGDDMQVPEPKNFIFGSIHSPALWACVYFVLGPVPLPPCCVLFPDQIKGRNILTKATTLCTNHNIIPPAPSLHFSLSSRSSPWVCLNGTCSEEIRMASERCPLRMHTCFWHTDSWIAYSFKNQKIVDCLCWIPLLQWSFDTLVLFVFFSAALFLRLCPDLKKYWLSTATPNTRGEH